jgi:hypothetical protein
MNRRYRREAIFEDDNESRAVRRPIEQVSILNGTLLDDHLTRAVGESGYE